MQGYVHISVYLSALITEMTLNLLENHIFQYTEPPIYFAEAW